jgi:hypothetical protein
MKNGLFCLVLILFILQTDAQTFSVEGKVFDADKGTPLSAANVTVINLRDSLMRGTRTLDDGRFIIRGLEPADYTYAVSFIGYLTHRGTFTIINSSVNLDTIQLYQDVLYIGEVVVEGYPPPVIIRGDTTEYTAGAYQVARDATAEDLVSKMPGITVEDGGVQVEGEEVRNVFVDGRPYFGQDPSTALRSIPAEVIDRIQVFDRLSEQVQFTGFDDGNREKSMNIVTHIEFRQGKFGNINTGYGPDDRYTASGNINILNDEQRISILGMMNNINEQNFSMADLLGVTGTSGGMRGGMRMGMGGGMGGAMRGGGSGRVIISPGGFAGRGSISDFLVSPRDGVTDTKSFGLNYQDNWGDRVEVTGSYFFNHTDNNLESSLNRTYLSDGTVNQFYSEQNLSISENLNHRFHARVDYKINRRTSLLVNPTTTFQHNEGNNDLAGSTNLGDAQVNSLQNIYGNDLSALNASSQFLLRHKFEKRGRTFSIDFSPSYNYNRGDNQQYSEVVYYDETDDIEVLDQISDIDRHGIGLRTNVTYTEPAGEWGLLQFTTAYNYGYDESDQMTYRDRIDDEYTVLDSTLSSVYTRVIHNQNAGASYQYNRNDISITAGLNYNINRYDNESKFPVLESIRTEFHSLLPSVSLRYSISQTQNLHVNYSTRANDPGITQLQNVLNNEDPLRLRLGNPVLSQDYSHTVSLRYTSMNIERMTPFFIMMHGSFRQNYIGTHTITAGRTPVVYNGIVIQPGAQLEIPENLDGFINLRSFIAFGKPVAFIKSNFNLNAMVNYTRLPSLLNEQTMYTHHNTYGVGLVLGSNISENIDFTISFRNNYIIVRSTEYRNIDEDYLTQRSMARLNLTIWQGFVVRTELEYRYDGGLAEERDPYSYRWNASIGKKIFSNRLGEIRFTVHDILESNRAQERIASELYVEDSRSNVLGRYYQLLFTYQIRAY